MAGNALTMVPFVTKQKADILIEDGGYYERDGQSPKDLLAILTTQLNNGMYLFKKDTILTNERRDGQMSRTYGYFNIRCVI